MNGQGADTPDLQAILATLSQFTNPAANSDVNNGQAGGVLHAGNTVPGAPSTAQQAPAPPAAEHAQDPRLRPQGRSATASPKPMINPATITTWQEGLRCVTKIAAQNAQFAASIRRMMDDQRKHELQWYSERQALKQAQAKRGADSAKAQSILQSLGNANSSAPTATQTEQEKETELSGFDRKIFVAQLAMEEAMVGELKGLGVPFFGTDQSLVVPELPDVSDQKLSEGRAKWSVLVTEKELVALRRKMIEHLEDLYRD